jgi:putative sigma-54 modulation protein
MELIIRSVNFNLDQKLEATLRNKFSRLQKLYQRLIICEITAIREKAAGGRDCILEGKVEMPRKTVFARESDSTFESVTDTLFDALKTQILHHKEQLQSHYSSSLNTLL